MAIEMLEKITLESAISVDCLLLLSRLYEKQQRFEKAISLLNRFKEVREWKKIGVAGGERWENKKSKSIFEKQKIQLTLISKSLTFFNQSYEFVCKINLRKFFNSII